MNGEMGIGGAGWLAAACRAADRLGRGARPPAARSPPDLVTRTAGRVRPFGVSCRHAPDLNLLILRRLSCLAPVGARPGSSGRDGSSRTVPVTVLRRNPVLTTAQAEHYRTFGFVVLRGFLADRVAALRAETGAAIHDAYAATYDERVIDGISGHYLPMAARLTPVSTSLVCDDPRFIDAAQQLLGGPVIPECPEGVLYFAEASWHDDDGIGVRGVKFAAYFDKLTAASGALRLVPGSHHPAQNTTGRCGRCTTASSRRSAASTGTATPSGGTGSTTPARIPAVPA